MTMAFIVRSPVNNSLALRLPAIRPAPPDRAARFVPHPACEYSSQPRENNVEYATQEPSKNEGDE